ncbi:MAG: TonB family protein [Deltaproteobacteria bacterium]|nr:TonB family protein [Deltaproteobacteria bacterium]
MGRGRLRCWPIAIALLAAGACADEGDVKPRVVDLAGPTVATEDAGAATAPSQQTPAPDDGKLDESAPDESAPDESTPDDGPDALVDPRDTAASKGTLPREAITAVFERGSAAVKKCYDRELKRTPTLAGRMVFSIKINRLGRVEAVRLRSATLKNRAIERCVVATIKRWRFPRPTGGWVLVTYPISFSAKND